MTSFCFCPSLCFASVASVCLFLVCLFVYLYFFATYFWQIWRYKIELRTERIALFFICKQCLEQTTDCHPNWLSQMDDGSSPTFAPFARSKQLLPKRVVIEPKGNLSSIIFNFYFFPYRHTHTHTQIQ